MSAPVLNLWSGPQRSSSAPSLSSKASSEFESFQGPQHSVPCAPLSTWAFPARSSSLLTCSYPSNLWVCSSARQSPPSPWMTDSCSCPGLFLTSAESVSQLSGQLSDSWNPSMRCMSDLAVEGHCLLRCASRPTENYLLLGSWRLMRCSTLAAWMMMTTWLLASIVCDYGSALARRYLVGCVTVYDLVGLSVEY